MKGLKVQSTTRSSKVYSLLFDKAMTVSLQNTFFYVNLLLRSIKPFTNNLSKQSNDTINLGKVKAV